MKNIIDFPDKSIITDEACEWVIAITRDEPPTAQTLAALNQWLATSATHKEIFQELASTWDGLDAMSAMVIPASVATAKRRSGLGLFGLWMLTPIVLLLRFIDGLARSLSTHAGYATAVVTLGIGISSFVMLNQGSTVYTTAIGERSTHTLSDGSSLWLNTNSKVEVSYSAEQRKIMLLKGEAHFEVKKDKSRPFEVYAGDRMVRAVGTAFSVYYDGDDVEVMVSEGKVDLAVISYEKITIDTSFSDKSTTLAHQKAEANPNHKAATRVGSLVAGESVIIPATIQGVANNIERYEAQDLARRLAWLEGRLVFVGEPLEDVVVEVSRYTPIKIEVIDEEIKQLKIGGNFQVGQTEKLFSALELGFNVKIVRISENYIQLYANN